MNAARLAVSLGALLLLGGGFVGALLMSLQGRDAEWAARMESPAVRILALALLLGAVALHFVRVRADEEDA